MAPVAGSAAPLAHLASYVLLRVSDASRFGRVQQVDLYLSYLGRVVTAMPQATSLPVRVHRVLARLPAPGSASSSSSLSSSTAAAGPAGVSQGPGDAAPAGGAALSATSPPPQRASRVPRALPEMRGAAVHTSVTQAVLSPATEVWASYAAYRVCVSVDMSPSMTAADPTTGELLITLAWQRLEETMRALVKPVAVPAQPSEHMPADPILLTVLVHSPLLEPVRPLVHGALLSADTLDGVLQRLRIAMDIAECEVAEAYTTRAGKRHSVVPMDLCAVLDTCMYALDVQPHDALPAIIIITDGVVGLNVEDHRSQSEQRSYASAQLRRMARDGVCCSIVLVGKQDHLTTPLGYLRDVPYLSYVAACTGGVLQDGFVVAADLHAAVFWRLLSGRAGVTTFRCVARSRQLHPDAVLLRDPDASSSAVAGTRQGAAFVVQKEPPSFPVHRSVLMDERVSGLSLRSHLHLRMMGGYFVDRVVIHPSTKPGTARDVLDITLRLRWEPAVVLEVQLCAAWPQRDDDDLACQCAVTLVAQAELIRQFGVASKHMMTPAADRLSSYLRKDLQEGPPLVKYLFRVASANDARDVMLKHIAEFVSHLEGRHDISRVLHCDSIELVLVPTPPSEDTSWMLHLKQGKAFAKARLMLEEFCSSWADTMVSRPNKTYIRLLSAHSSMPASSDQTAGPSPPPESAAAMSVAANGPTATVAAAAAALSGAGISQSASLSGQAAGSSSGSEDPVMFYTFALVWLSPALVRLDVRFFCPSADRVLRELRHLARRLARVPLGMAQDPQRAFYVVRKAVVPFYIRPDLGDEHVTGAATATASAAGRVPAASSSSSSSTAAALAQLDRPLYQRVSDRARNSFQWYKRWNWWLDTPDLAMPALERLIDCRVREGFLVLHSTGGVFVLTKEIPLAVHTVGEFSAASACLQYVVFAPSANLLVIELRMEPQCCWATEADLGVHPDTLWFQLVQRFHGADSRLVSALASFDHLHTMCLQDNASAPTSHQGTPAASSSRPPSRGPVQHVVAEDAEMQTVRLNLVGLLHNARWRRCPYPVLTLDQQERGNEADAASEHSADAGSSEAGAEAEQSALLLHNQVLHRLLRSVVAQMFNFQLEFNLADKVWEQDAFASQYPHLADAMCWVKIVAANKLLLAFLPSLSALATQPDAPVALEYFEVSRWFRSSSMDTSPLSEMFFAHEDMVRFDSHRLGHLPGFLHVTSADVAASSSSTPAVPASAAAAAAGTASSATTAATASASAAAAASHPSAAHSATAAAGAGDGDASDSQMSDEAVLVVGDVERLYNIGFAQQVYLSALSGLRVAEQHYRRAMESCYHYVSSVDMTEFASALRQHAGEHDTDIDEAASNTRERFQHVLSMMYQLDQVYPQTFLGKIGAAGVYSATGSPAPGMSAMLRGSGDTAAATAAVNAAAQEPTAVVALTALSPAERAAMQLTSGDGDRDGDVAVASTSSANAASFVPLEMASPALARRSSAAETGSDDEDGGDDDKDGSVNAADITAASERAVAEEQDDDANTVTASEEAGGAAMAAPTFLQLELVYEYERESSRHDSDQAEAHVQIVPEDAPQEEKTALAARMMQAGQEQEQPTCQVQGTIITSLELPDILDTLQSLPTTLVSLRLALHVFTVEAYRPEETKPRHTRAGVVTLSGRDLLPLLMSPTQPQQQQQQQHGGPVACATPAPGSPRGDMASVSTQRVAGALSAGVQLPDELPHSSAVMLADTYRAVRTVISDILLHWKTWEPTLQPSLLHAVADAAPIIAAVSPYAVQDVVEVKFVASGSASMLRQHVKMLSQLMCGDHWFPLTPVDSSSAYVTGRPRRRIDPASGQAIPIGEPAFWLVIQPGTGDYSVGRVSVTLHSLDMRPQQRQGVLMDVRAALEGVTRLINQRTLLEQLNELRVPDELLLPPAMYAATKRKDETRGKATGHTLGAVVRALNSDVRLGFRAGQFACKLQHTINIPLHPLLKAQHAKEQLAAYILPLFEVDDHKNLFVYAERQSTNVFYMHLTSSHDAVPDGSTTPSLSRGVSAAAETTGSGGGQREIRLLVYGVAKPSNEITCELRDALANKLTQLTILQIASCFERNQMYPMTWADLSFIRSAMSEPLCLLMPLSSETAHCGMLVSLVRENLAGFLFRSHVDVNVATSAITTSAPSTSGLPPRGGGVSEHLLRRVVGSGGGSGAGRAAAVRTPVPSASASVRSPVLYTTPTSPLAKAMTSAVGTTSDEESPEAVRSKPRHAVRRRSSVSGTPEAVGRRAGDLSATPLRVSAGVHDAAEAALSVVSTPPQTSLLGRVNEDEGDDKGGMVTPREISDGSDNDDDDNSNNLDDSNDDDSDDTGSDSSKDAADVDDVFVYVPSADQAQGIGTGLALLHLDLVHAGTQRRITGDAAAANTPLALRLHVWPRGPINLDALERRLFLAFRQALLEYQIEQAMLPQLSGVADAADMHACLTSLLREIRTAANLGAQLAYHNASAVLLPRWALAAMLFTCNLVMRRVSVVPPSLLLHVPAASSSLSPHLISCTSAEDIRSSLLASGKRGALHGSALGELSGSAFSIVAASTPFEHVSAAALDAETAASTSSAAASTSSAAASTSSAAATSLGVETRRHMLALSIDDDGVHVYAYNWPSAVRVQLIKQLSDAMDWISLRGAVLDSILVQKLGLFHMQVRKIPPGASDVPLLARAINEPLPRQLLEQPQQSQPQRGSGKAGTPTSNASIRAGLLQSPLFQALRSNHAAAGVGSGSSNSSTPRLSLPRAGAAAGGGGTPRRQPHHHHHQHRRDTSLASSNARDTSAGTSGASSTAPANLVSDAAGTPPPVALAPGAGSTAGGSGDATPTPMAGSNGVAVQQDVFGPGASGVVAPHLYAGVRACQGKLHAVYPMSTLPLALGDGADAVRAHGLQFLAAVQASDERTRQRNRLIQTCAQWAKESDERHGAANATAGVNRMLLDSMLQMSRLMHCVRAPICYHNRPSPDLLRLPTGDVSAVLGARRRRGGRSARREAAAAQAVRNRDADAPGAEAAGDEDVLQLEDLDVPKTGADGDGDGGGGGTCQDDSSASGVDAVDDDDDNEDGDRGESQRDEDEESVNSAFLLYEHLYERFVDEYSAYLETIGLRRINILQDVPNKDESVAAAASVASSAPETPVSSSARRRAPIDRSKKTYLQKAFKGGLLLVEIAVQIVFAGCNLWVTPISTSTARDDTEVQRQFSEQCSKIQHVVRLNSFTWDFQLRALYTYILQPDKEFPQINLIPVLRTMLSAWPRPPIYSRNRLRQFTQSIPLPSGLDPGKFFRYCCQHAGRWRCFNLEARGVPHILCAQSRSPTLLLPHDPASQEDETPAEWGRQFLLLTVRIPTSELEQYGVTAQQASEGAQLHLLCFLLRLDTGVIAPWTTPHIGHRETHMPTPGAPGEHPRPHAQRRVGALAAAASASPGSSLHSASETVGSGSWSATTPTSPHLDQAPLPRRHTRPVFQSQRQPRERRAGQALEAAAVQDATAAPVLGNPAHAPLSAPADELDVAQMDKAYESAMQGLQSLVTEVEALFMRDQLWERVQDPSNGPVTSFEFEDMLNHTRRSPVTMLDPSLRPLLQLSVPWTEFLAWYTKHARRGSTYAQVIEQYYNVLVFARASSLVLLHAVPANNANELLLQYCWRETQQDMASDVDLAAATHDLICDFIGSLCYWMYRSQLR